MCLSAPDVGEQHSNLRFTGCYLKQPSSGPIFQALKPGDSWPARSPLSEYFSLDYQLKQPVSINISHDMTEIFQLSPFCGVKNLDVFAEFLDNLFC
jgi:hypothetical protein